MTMVKERVEERAKAGAKARGGWIRRCKTTMREVKRATFVRLMEMLVESVLATVASYGLEVAMEACRAA